MTKQKKGVAISVVLVFKSLYTAISNILHCVLESIKRYCSYIGRFSSQMFVSLSSSTIVHRSLCCCMDSHRCHCWQSPEVLKWHVYHEVIRHSVNLLVETEQIDQQLDSASEEGVGHVPEQLDLESWSKIWYPEREIYHRQD